MPQGQRLQEPEAICAPLEPRLRLEKAEGLRRRAEAGCPPRPPVLQVLREHPQGARP